MNLKQKLLGRYTMLPSLFALAWPTMLEQLMGTAVQYVDTAMVGSLGTQATAAVGATTTVNWLIGSTISAIGVGFLAYIARAMGAGEPERAKAAAAQSITMTAIAGVIFSIICIALHRQVPIWMQVDADIRDLAGQYFLIVFGPMLFRSSIIILGTVLRAAGDTQTPMRVGIAVNLINTVLNFFFIYPTRTWLGITIPGAGWGVEGAAIASAVSFVLGGLAIAWHLWRHPAISPRGYSLLPDKEILKPCFRVAFPNMLQRFATSFGYVAFAAMINALGDMSTAAHTIANTVESLFYIPGYGMQTAAATLAGNAMGSKEKGRIRELGRAAIPLEIGLMMVTGAMLFVLAPFLMRIFSKDKAVIALGATILRMVAASEPFFGISIIIEGMMQGMGRTREPFFYNILGMWGIRIVGTFICTRILGFGLVSAWACMIAHNLLLCGLFIGYYRKRLMKEC